MVDDVRAAAGIASKQKRSPAREHLDVVSSMFPPDVSGRACWFGDSGPADSNLKPTETGLSDNDTADKGLTDTGSDDPGPADTDAADAGLAETDPSGTDTADTGSADTEPADTNRPDILPADLGLANIDSACTDPADSDPGQTDNDPTDTDPADTDPAWGCYCGSRVSPGLSVSVIHLLTSLQAAEAARPVYNSTTRLG
jgi:hypothetical protein